MRTRIKSLLGNRGKLSVAVFILSMILGCFLLLFGGLTVGYMWTLDAGEQLREIHLFHDVAQAMGTGILPGLALVIVALSNGRNVLVARFLLLFAVTLIVAGILFDLFLLVPAFILGGLVFGLSPDRPKLVGFSNGLSFSFPLIPIALCTAIPLLANAYTNADMQLGKVGGEHYEMQHWAATAIMDISIVLMVLLAATKQPGWRLLSVMGGMGLLIAGITSLMVPDNAGSWGSAGGMVAVIAGVFYLTIPAWQHDPTKQSTREMSPDAAPST